MGKVPDLKRIAKEDFPSEYQTLIEKLAFPLNSHMEQVRNLFSKGIETSIKIGKTGYLPLKA